MLRPDQAREPARLAKKTTARRPDENILTLIWWFIYVSEYRGKLADMQKLADKDAWDICDIDDASNFLGYVKKQAMKWHVESPPAWAL